MSAKDYAPNLKGYKKFLTETYGITYQEGVNHPMVMTLREFKNVERRTDKQILEDELDDVVHMVCKLQEQYKNATCDVIKRHHGGRLKVLNARYSELLDAVYSR